MTTTTTNGQSRKTLASQLDRLDSILDGLSDALNGAVASAVEGAVERAVRQAVGEAVQETLQAVVAEVIAHPDLLAAARGILSATPLSAVPADPPERPKGVFRRACAGVKAGLGAAATACGGAGAYLLRQAAAVKSVALTGWLLFSR